METANNSIDLLFLARKNELEELSTETPVYKLDWAVLAASTLLDTLKVSLNQKQNARARHAKDSPKKQRTVFDFCTYGIKKRESRPFVFLENPRRGLAFSELSYL